MSERPRPVCIGRVLDFDAQCRTCRLLCTIAHSDGYDVRTLGQAAVWHQCGEPGGECAIPARERTLHIGPADAGLNGLDPLAIDLDIDRCDSLAGERPSDNLEIAAYRSDDSTSGRLGQIDVEPEISDL